MMKHFWILAGLTVLLLGLAGVSRAGDFDSLGATGVTLYEISERVTFDPDPSSAGMIRRNATSPLQGFAEVGTPLCPAELLWPTRPPGCSARFRSQSCCRSTARF